jgi:hypothetical protein
MTKTEIVTREQEIRAEIKTLEDIKKANPLSYDDSQDCSDAYQERLEINWQLADLYYELDHLDEPHEEPDREPEFEYPQ